MLQRQRAQRLRVPSTRVTTARWIALSGTPGVGKTTVAKLLRRHGIAVWDGRRLAKEAGAYVGRDRTRRTRIVDVLRVSRYVEQHAPAAPPVLIDSHWSHEIPAVTAVVVLRLRPRRLRARLLRRRWSAAKIAENVEAEGMGIILSETARRLRPERIAELDVTGMTAREVVRRLLPFIGQPDSRLTNLEIGRVDWTPDFLEWSLTATAGSSTRS